MHNFNNQTVLNHSFPKINIKVCISNWFNQSTKIRNAN